MSETYTENNLHPATPPPLPHTMRLKWGNPGPSASCLFPWLQTSTLTVKIQPPSPPPHPLGTLCYPISFI
jgi:hypothetical protein